MRIVSVKFKLKLLTMGQKQFRLGVVQDILDCANGDTPFLNTVITGVLGLRVRPGNQGTIVSVETFTIPETKPKQVWSNMKVMLTVLFESCGVLHYEYAPKSQIIKKGRHLEFTHCLHDAVQHKWQDLWQEELGSSIMTTHQPILRIWFRFS